MQGERPAAFWAGRRPHDAAASPCAPAPLVIRRFADGVPAVAGMAELESSERAGGMPLALSHRDNARWRAWSPVRRATVHRTGR